MHKDLTKKIVKSVGKSLGNFRECIYCNEDAHFQLFRDIRFTS